MTNQQILDLQRQAQQAHPHFLLGMINQTDLSFHISARENMLALISEINKLHIKLEGSLFSPSQEK